MTKLKPSEINRICWLINGEINWQQEFLVQDNEIPDTQRHLEFLEICFKKQEKNKGTLTYMIDAVV